MISEYIKRINLSDKSLVGVITDSCFINKDLPCFNKTKTKGCFGYYILSSPKLIKLFSKGILTVSHGCGIVLRFNEMISSESRTSVLYILNEVFKITKFKYKYCLYDDGCHLDESLKIHINEYPELNDLKIYIDRFHIKNHVRNVNTRSLFLLIIIKIFF